MLIGSLVILLCAFNFNKARNALSSLHFVIISNNYGISLLLFGFTLKQTSLIAAGKIIALIIVNIVITMIIAQISSNLIAKKNLKL